MREKRKFITRYVIPGKVSMAQIISPVGSSEPGHKCGLQRTLAQFPYTSETV